MAKPKGHKKNCRCAICKNARKGHRGGKKKSGHHSKHSAAEKRAHVKRLRVELREVKTGERAASRNGDAKSWASFTSKRKSLEAQIKRR